MGGSCGSAGVSTGAVASSAVPSAVSGDHSIGKFEGDTLVVDTVGFNDKTWLDPMGLPHSEAMHLTERIRRVDHDTLVDEYTIDDPKAYTQPWKATRTFKLKPDWQIKEYVCTENNLVK